MSPDAPRQGSEATDIGRGLERDPHPMCGAAGCQCKRRWQGRQRGNAQPRRLIAEARAGYSPVRAYFLDM